jgi:hypothetical protein
MLALATPVPRAKENPAGGDAGHAATADGRGSLLGP